jgi:hypothetical protein
MDTTQISMIMPHTFKYFLHIRSTYRQVPEPSWPPSWPLSCPISSLSTPVHGAHIAVIRSKWVWKDINASQFSQTLSAAAGISAAWRTL